MAKNGILINYHYCTGCHSCEVACQQEHNYPADVFGITVTEHVLKTLDGLSLDYVPFLTDLCNRCAHRTAKGEKPACVKHCQAFCMDYGPLDELQEKMKEGSKMILFSAK